MRGCVAACRESCPPAGLPRSVADGGKEEEQEEQEEQEEEEEEEEEKEEEPLVTSIIVSRCSLQPLPGDGDGDRGDGISNGDN